jgi:predicted component of type VI protein secretion system
MELVLSAGQSSTASLVFTPEVPATRAMLGSGPVDWPIAAGGVDAQHAEIAWDGATLYIRDAGSVRGTFVNGQRIAESDWCALQGGEEVRLGQAVLHARPPGAAPAPVQEREEFEDQATQVSAGLSIDRVQLSEAAPPRPASAAVPPAKPLPRAPFTADRKPPPAAGDHEPASSESTMIVQNPYAQGDSSSSPSLTPLAGRSAAAPPPRVTSAHAAPPLRVTSAQPVPAQGEVLFDSSRSNEATMAINVPDGPVPPAMLGAAPPPVMGGAAMPAAGGFANQAFVPTAPGQFVPSAPMAIDAAAATNDAFGPPPELPRGELTNIFGSLPPLPPAQPRPTPKSAALAALEAMPKRTRILLGATLAAGLLMLIVVFSGGSEAPAASTRPVAPPEPPRPMQAFTPPIPGPPAGPTGTLLAATMPPPPPPAAPVDPPHPPPPPPPPESFPERIAADMIVQGRLREAVARYDALAVAHPETPVYSHIATILRRRLEAQQQQTCVPGGPTPCAPIAPAAAPMPAAAPAPAAPAAPPSPR